MAKEKKVTEVEEKEVVKDTEQFFVKVSSTSVADKLQIVNIDGQPALDKNCTVFGIKKEGQKNLLIFKINDSVLSDLDDKEKNYVVRIDEKELKELTKQIIFPTPSQIDSHKDKQTIKPLE